jgi:hypothetical protein
MPLPAPDQDISKLTPKEVTGKNGHQRTVYIRLGLPIKKDDKVAEKEPYDSSNEKAKTLKVEDFGSPEEVREMAKPIRQAKTRPEAEKALENIISSNGTMSQSAIELRSKSGLSAFLRRSSIGKLVSVKQEKEMPTEALWQAAANIDKLYTNAIEPWRFELNPNKNNNGLRDRRILYAPMDFADQIIPVKLTVKEYLDPLAAAKLYSIEAIDFDLGKKKEGAGTLTAINPK